MENGKNGQTSDKSDKDSKFKSLLILKHLNLRTKKSRNLCNCIDN